MALPMRENSMRVFSASHDIQIRKALPTRFFSGTVPQRRLSSEPSRLSPIAKYSPGGTMNSKSSADRKSVGSGKSGSVRVDLGGRRTIQKQKRHTSNKIKIRKST